MTSKINAVQMIFFMFTSINVLQIGIKQFKLFGFSQSDIVVVGKFAQDRLNPLKVKAF